ncbi:sce7725 family protein [Clavibacter michiganensis]|uniref:sce7725 family protein n=1 Tax=Clavibacter michiganensis TaxID=28447 RepID=UPI0009C6D894|nr:sce7725 family protein [Clavibacter michiganensis]MBF4637226.1 sce7725 family protein [Clavibacter michiganensis subsp. michiganensis]MDO4125891.1 sce7725 family protein [Clavibacter michiganensis]MDO4141237.1 sce7725 family protein [Clavibacter michiganensis]OUD83357.1 hypothetical protein CMMCAS02_10580 [Clavibacter michiganensis subsp. michiganensis]OUD96160.1 hypothetical protein CMMCAS03_01315 [Clavibacter michiganensis subsp. michiganensis]
MYYPYFRGKQYELLALRDTAGLLGVEQSVRPIIEPVRQPENSGLDRCLGALKSAHVAATLVVNPSVGDLKGDSALSSLSLHLASADANQPAMLGLILSDSSDVRSLFGAYSRKFGSRYDLALLHKAAHPDIDYIREWAATHNAKMNVIQNGLRRRHFDSIIPSAQAVTIRDAFVSEPRNAEFLERQESVFTDDHLFYAEDGWAGFSDYLTVGEPFATGGFQPRAVVIHWTFEREVGGPVMIRHFTSVSNADTADVAGKFLQALDKLVAFLDSRDLQTRAATVMREHARNRTYPGLGTLKKLSIQNHLELMSGILAR